MDSSNSISKEYHILVNDITKANGLIIINNSRVIFLHETIKVQIYPLRMKDEFKNDLVNVEDPTKFKFMEGKTQDFV